MALQTGNDCTSRPVLRLSDVAPFDDSDAVLYITDLSVSGTNNLASYTTVDQCGTFKLPTTQDRSISLTFLRDGNVYADVSSYFEGQKEINWELSPLGVAPGMPYKTGVAYISSMSEQKNGTNVWEIQIQLDVNGDVTTGTHV